MATGRRCADPATSVPAPPPDSRRGRRWPRRRTRCRLHRAAHEFSTSIEGVGASTDQNVRRSSAETPTSDRTVNGLVLDTGSNFAIGGASHKLTVASGMVSIFGAGTTTLSMQVTFAGLPTGGTVVLLR